MAYVTGFTFIDLLVSIILDVRFQVIFATVGLLHWCWRLPRPMKGAGLKTVVITGCDSGMGHRIARRFDEMGMYVFAGCLNPEGSGAKSLKTACSHRLHVMPLDITNDDSVREAVAYVKGNLPPGQSGLYCLVNNAGVMSYAAFDLMSMDMCQQVVDVNVMGTIRTTKYFLPLISKAPGRIVTITSILARMTIPNLAMYTATKHALNGFFSSLRYELENKGIHVATIEPGDFSTTTDIMQWTQTHLEEMWKNLSPDEKQTKKHLYEDAKKRVHKTKLSQDLQEQNYKLLLEDVEDATLAEEPYWRYVTAPVSKRLALWVFRMLPEEITAKFMAKSVR